MNNWSYRSSSARTTSATSAVNVSGESLSRISLMPNILLRFATVDLAVVTESDLAVTFLRQGRQVGEPATDKGFNP